MIDRVFEGAANAEPVHLNPHISTTARPPGRRRRSSASWIRKRSAVCAGTGSRIGSTAWSHRSKIGLSSATAASPRPAPPRTSCRAAHLLLRGFLHGDRAADDDEHGRVDVHRVHVPGLTAKQKDVIVNPVSMRASSTSRMREDPQLLVPLQQRAGVRGRADSNDDGGLHLSDAVTILNALFSGGSSIAPPYPARGSDPTAVGLPACGT